MMLIDGGWGVWETVALGIVVVGIVAICFIPGASVVATTSLGSVAVITSYSIHYTKLYDIN